MATVDQVLKIEQSQIGYTESPPNSNKTKYGESSGWNGVAWCVIFQWWCFHEAGADKLFYDGGKTAGCYQVMTWAKKVNQWITGGYKPGDLVLFDFTGNGEPDHIGFVETFNGKTITTIEGNTSITSNDNGGKVMRRTRTLANVLGAVRPKYENTATQSPSTGTAGGFDVAKLNTLRNGSRGTEVKAMQTLLIGYGYSIYGGDDGIFGSYTDTTLKKYQKAKGIEVDGICGPITWGKLLGVS